MDHTYIAYLSKSFLPKDGLFHRYLHFSMLCEFQGQGHTSTKRGYISFYQTVVVIMLKMHRFEDIGTSKYCIVTVTFQVIQGQRSWCQMKDYMHNTYI